MENNIKTLRGFMIASTIWFLITNFYFLPLPFLSSPQMFMLFASVSNIFLIIIVLYIFFSISYLVKSKKIEDENIKKILRKKFKFNLYYSISLLIVSFLFTFIWMWTTAANMPCWGC